MATGSYSLTDALARDQSTTPSAPTDASWGFDAYLYATTTVITQLTFRHFGQETECHLANTFDLLGADPSHPQCPILARRRNSGQQPSNAPKGVVRIVPAGVGHCLLRMPGPKPPEKPRYHMDCSGKRSASSPGLGSSIDLGTHHCTTEMIIIGNHSPKL